jgi:uncharacterized protein
MILRLIGIAVVMLGIWKLLGGKLPNFKLQSKDDKKLDNDTLVECESCGLFVTAKEAIIAKGKYYCSLECANK